jgi:phage replication O-like protein O
MMRTTRTVSYIPYSFVPNHTATIEALARSKLSGRQFRVVLFIMRQTDGYLRNEDRIRPDYFARNTGIGKDHVPHILSSLKKLNIITVKPGTPPFYSVNPPDQWSPTVFAKNGDPPSPKMARNLAKFGEKQLCTKDNLKKTMNNITRSKDNEEHENTFIWRRYGHIIGQTHEEG